MLFCINEFILGMEFPQGEIFVGSSHVEWPGGNILLRICMQLIGMFITYIHASFTSVVLLHCSKILYIIKKTMK